MAIKFAGEFEVKKPPEEVFDFLTDPNRFASLLPDFKSLTVQDATNFTIKVDVGISYIKGSADVKMELTEADRRTGPNTKVRDRSPVEMSRWSRVSISRQPPPARK